MAKKRYEADYVLNLNKTIASLQNAKKQAEEFDDIMSQIGDRGNFNKLIKHFLSLDSVVDDLRQNANELMSGLGDSLKGGYISSLDEVFNKLAEISKKSHELFNGINNIDLDSADAGKQLSQYASQLNELFSSLNVKNRINLKVFETKSVEEQAKRLIKAAQILNTEINTSLGSINVGNISGEIENALGGAGLAIEDFSADIRKAIEDLEEQNKRLQDVQKDLKKTAKMINDVKSKGNSAIPEDFVLDSKDIKVDKIVGLLDEYDELDKQMKSGKLSAEDYADKLMRLTEITMTLKNAFSGIRANDSLKNLFTQLPGGSRGGNLLGAISTYANVKSEGLFNKVIKSAEDDDVGKLINANAEKIEQIKRDAMKNLGKGSGGGDGTKKAIISYDELISKIKELNKVMEERDAHEDDEDYAIYDQKVEEVERLRDSFLDLVAACEKYEEVEKTIGHFVYGKISEDEAISKLADQLDISRQSQGDGVAGTGTGTGHRIINSEQLKKDLEQVRELAFKTNKELSFSVDVDGIKYVVESVEGITKISDEAATAVHSLGSSLTILAHSHPSGNGYFSAGDINSALNAKNSGVNAPIMSLGKDMASVLNLAGVTEDVISRIKATLGDISDDDIITPKKFKEIQDILKTGGFEDALRTFSISDGMEDLSVFLKKIGEEATDAQTPLEKFQSLVMYYSNGKINTGNLSEFGDYWDEFTKGAKTASEIFDAVMAKIDAKDLDGNQLRINTADYKALEVAMKNIAVGSQGTGIGIGSGDGTSGIDDDEVQKAKELLAVIEKIKTAVNEKTDAFKQEKATVDSVIPDEVKVLNDLYVKVKDVEDKLTNIIKLDVKALDFTSWIEQLNKVLDSLNQLGAEFTNINSVLGNLNTNFNDVVNKGANANSQQAQVDNMKSALSQLLKTVTDHNNQKDSSGEYTHQELSAQLLSNQSFVIGHGEKGSVPWNVSIEAILSDLLHPLIMDVHSHPWGDRYDPYGSGGDVFSNDMFSGSHGDLSAWRTSKKFGAQLASMITGNFLHVFDISKLSNQDHNNFVSNLRAVEQEYANDPKYSKYIGYNKQKGSTYYKRQSTLADYHDMTAAFKQMMLDALSRTGFSDSDIKDIYKEYNLTNDDDLTKIATRLVDLSNASTKAIDPIDRLREMLIAIGTNDIARNARKTAREAYNNGDLSKYEETKRLIRDYAGDKYDAELARLDALDQSNPSEKSDLYSALFKIVNSFGSDIESVRGQAALDGLRKGELDVATVFNEFQDRYSKVSQLTIDQLNKIDPSAQDSAEMNVLSTISSTLSSIDSKLSSIEINTQRTLSEEFGAAADALVHTSGHVDGFGFDDINNSLLHGQKTTVDENNVTEYKAQELYKAASEMYNTFSNNLNYAFDKFESSNELNPSEIKEVLNTFSVAFAKINDAKIQAKLYEDRYAKTLTGEYGQLMTDSLDGFLHDLSNVDKLLKLVTNAKTVVDNNVKFGNLSRDVGDVDYNDDDSVLISNILRDIYSVINNIANKLGSNPDINNMRSYENTHQNVNYQDVIGTTDISSEEQQLNALVGTLNTVITAINAKTLAFGHEADTVDAAVNQEITALKSLENYLITIRTLIETLTNNIQTGNIFDAWIQNLNIIEANVKNILGYFSNIAGTISGTNFNGPVTPTPNTAPTPPAPIPNNNQNGVYALESTLQHTNSILDLIHKAITTGGNNNLAQALQDATNELKNVANGIVQQQKTQKADTRAAGDRIADPNTYKQISDIAKNAVNALGSEIQLDGLTALKDGVVKVDGAFKNASGIWEGFSVKVNTSNQAVDLAIKKQSAFAKALNEASAAAGSAAGQQTDLYKKTKSKMESGITGEQTQFNKRISGHLADFAGSDIFTTQLDAYNDSVQKLEDAYKKLSTTSNLSEQDILDIKKSFDEAKGECEDYRRALIKLINDSQKFASTHSNVEDYIGGFNLGDPTGQEDALKDYINAVYGGKAVIGDFDAANKELAFTLKNNDGTISRMAASFDASMTKIGSSIIKPQTTLLGSFVDGFWKKSKELWTYASARLGVDELIQQIRNGLNYVREIDTALTELKKVTDETDASYNRFLQDMSKTADVVGSTVAELTTMASEWARLGYSMEEAGKLAESTAILLNVSEFKDATTASEALISTMQAFSYTANESQHVVDILNEVGNNFAVSSDGLAVALQDSASALMEGGNNLEQSVALIAAANKVVQDPNSVGSALRTISLRLRGTSVEVLEQMGEETDGAVESVSKMQEKIKALTGVDIVDMNGAYKDTYTILYEIANVWEDMADMDQAALLELMAGKNRANTLAAILGNMEDLEGAYKSAMNAEGSALRENEAYLDSIQGRIDIFKNALQTFWMNFIDSGTVKGIVDLGTALMKLLDTLHGKLLAITGAYMVYKKMHDGVKFTDMFSGVVKTSKDVLASIKLITVGTQSLTVATIKQTLASNGVSKSHIKQIISSAKLSTVTGVLTKTEIQAAAATLSKAYADGKLTAAQYLATMSTMGLKTAMQGLWKVLTKNPVYLIAAAIAGIALAFDHFHTTVQEEAEAAHEAFEEIQNIVDSTKSAIQELENELSTLQEKIDNLEGKKLSFAEDQELKKLQNQREELEHSLKVQQQLLELQQGASNKQAVASMKAYTKAASQGAKETQETAKNWGTIGGIILGAGLVIGGLALAPVSGGTSTALSAMGAKAIAGSVAAGAIAVGVAGNKAGEAAGSAITKNDGTYDSWYKTYADALNLAKEKEQQALEDYQKDSSNIDKLDKWQEAQKKTSDIETEMYEHLSQMQQYYKDIEYGQGYDEELDEWYNFLDKLSIEEGASGAEVTALDRIFGKNASEEIKQIEGQILNAIASGEDFDFDKAINGSEELKSVLEYIGLDAEDVKNYFTQIGEAAAQSEKSITAFKSYSDLSADVENYKNILLQSNDILAEGTLATEDYYNALLGLGVNEEALGECIDKNNGFMITNVDLLKDIVKETSKGVSADVKLAKSQSRLKYYDLYKEMRQLTNGSGDLTDATRDQVNALYKQMGAIEKTIAKYSMLEQELLGATSAFTNFENAQTVDSETDYISSVESMVLSLGEAFNTAALGSETAQAAIAGLVPESVYKDLDTAKEKMDAIYSYFKNGKLSQYLDIQYNEDGEIESAEMKLANLKNFINDGLKNGTFVGDDWQHFDLSEGIKTLDGFANAMNVTKEVAFAFFDSIEDHDIEWLNGDYSTLFDKLIPDISTIKTLKEQMQKEFDQANVDLSVRPRVSWEKMHEANWFTEEGSYSTVDTQTYFASDFGLAEKGSENDYAINVTPILPDGTVIDNGKNGEGLWEYIMGKVDSGESIEDLDIFLGSYKTLEEAKVAADRLHDLQAEYFSALENYDLETNIYNNISALADLEYQLANGKISAEEYASKFNELNNINNELANKAREEASAWHEKTSQLEEYKNKLQEYQSQLESGKDSEGNIIDSEQVKKNIDEVSGDINDLVEELAKLDEPTEVTLQFAIDDIDKDLKEITDKIGDVIENTHYTFDNITGEYKVIIDESDPNYQEVMNYVNLLNEQHVLSLQMGEETPTVVGLLSNISSILDNIKTVLEQQYNINVEADDALEKTNKFKSLWDSIKDKGVTLWSSIKEIIGTPDAANTTYYNMPRVNGTAHATGDWGLPKAEYNSLVGELGQELVVDPHSGRYYTVGDNGAEFVDLPKDAIIFNHQQTKDLLSHGYVTGRGKAYAEGNAHVELYPNAASKSQMTIGGRDGSDAAEDIKDEVEEVVDFIEIKLEEIEATIAKTTAELENYVDDTSTVSEKNNLYDNLVSAEKNRADTYLMAAEEYNRKATEALKEIPAEYRKMAMNGAIAIKDFVGEDQAEIAEAISKYRDWSNKADDAEVGYLESIAEQAALRVEQLQDIASDYENIIGVIETSSGLIEAHMDFVEESGKRLSATYYNKLIKNSEDQKKKLEEERKDLQRIFDRAVRSGDVEKGSDEWYEMLDTIYEVDEAIVQCNTDIEEFNNSINELKFENLEKLIDRFDDIDSQLSHLHDRFTDGKIVDDEGDWNSDGIAAIGVLTQQMEVAEMKSRQYAEAIDELKEDYKNGLYSEDEFNEKLAELTENQWDAIESYESAKDAIVDLNKTRIDAVKDGIQEEIDAYKELIDKKKEALDADKDLYDFEKNVKEQQKDIATIERKLAALSGDTSASAAAQRKVLEAELAEAKANLEDTYRDRSIENQKNALDDSYEKFEEAKNKEMEALDEYLEREDEVIGDSVDIVKEKENAKTVLEELKAVSEQYGIDISNAIVSPWEDGANAVMSYDNQFGEVSESFIAKLQAIIDKEKELQKEADNTATGIINGIEESEKDTTSAKRKSSSGGSSRDDGIRGWTDEELAASEVGAPQGGSSGGSNSISKGQTVVVDKNAKNFSSKSGNASMASFVKGGTYEVMQTSGNQVLIGKGGTATGWVDKKDLDGYAKGTTKIKDDQFAWIDEIGEELVLHAGSDGKLAYLTKGSGVIPADLTSKLMELALDPTQTLENSRPIINAPHITNNEINIDMTFGEVVHIDTVTNDTIPDLTKAVEKQMDKYMKNLNNQIRRYAK